MNSIESKFKSNLIKINNDIVKREHRQESLLFKCVGDRLNDSLSTYEHNLMDTCQYVLMRKPVIMIKDFELLNKEAEENKLNENN